MYSTKAYSKMAAKTKTIHPNCQTSVAFKLIDLGAASLKNKITYFADKIDMVLPSLCLKILKKIITFIVRSSVTLETFGDSFLPLENSFRFFQILLDSFRLFYIINTQNLKESERI